MPSGRCVDNALWSQLALWSSMAEKANGRFLRSRVVEASPRLNRAYVPLAVCGDPVAGRAIALLLQGAGYDARFVPSPALGASSFLEEVEVVLLTLTSEPDAERRRIIGKAVRSAAETHGAPVLELVVASATLQEVARGDVEYVVLWPCSTEVLLESIENAQKRFTREEG